MSNGNNSEKYLNAVDTLAANDYVRCLKSNSSRNITLANLITSIATAGGSNRLGVVTTDTNYLATVANDVILVDVAVATRQITLPAASTSLGKVITVKKKDGSTNDVTVQAASGNIDGTASVTLSGSGGARPGAEFISDGTDWYIMNA